MQQSAVTFPRISFPPKTAVWLASCFLLFCTQPRATSVSSSRYQQRHHPHLDLQVGCLQNQYLVSVAVAPSQESVLVGIQRCFGSDSSICLSNFASMTPTQRVRIEDLEGWLFKVKTHEKSGFLRRLTGAENKRWFRVMELPNDRKELTLCYFHRRSDRDGGAKGEMTGG